MAWLEWADTSALTQWALLNAQLEQRPTKFSASKHSRLAALRVELGMEPGSKRSQQHQEAQPLPGEEYFR